MHTPNMNLAKCSTTWKWSSKLESSAAGSSLLDSVLWYVYKDPLLGLRLSHFVMFGLLPGAYRLTTITQQFFICLSALRCIMKMDHHCQWINSCIGYGNHAAFIHFLFFASLACIHALTVNCNFLFRFYTNVCIRNNGTVMTYGIPAIM